MIGRAGIPSISCGLTMGGLRLVVVLIGLSFFAAGDARAQEAAGGMAFDQAPHPAAIVREEGNVVDPERQGLRRPAETGAIKRRDTGSGLGLDRMLMALALVIALILLLRYAGKKLFPGAVAAGTTRVMQVVSRTPIAPKQQLMLVQVGSRLIVVGDAGGQMAPLCQIDDPNEVASLLGQIQREKEQSVTRSFSSMFGRARDKFTEPDEPPAVEGASPLGSTLDLVHGEMPEGVGHVLEDRLHGARLTSDTLSGARAKGEASSPANPGEEPDESSLRSTRDELSGLMEKVRVLSQHFRRA